jgi:hypothetical protein
MDEKSMTVPYAVMSQRQSPKSVKDNFPTPPWATRALLTYIIPGAKGTVWEPACGAGHMSKVLQTHFQKTLVSDAYHYPHHRHSIIDFTRPLSTYENVDWIITNPPFKLAETFITTALSIATQGVAIFARSVLLESVGRYERLFKDNPPSIFAQFVERVPIITGHLDPNATTATAYAWFVWLKPNLTPDFTRLMWIPPCRSSLEEAEDYGSKSKP